MHFKFTLTLLVIIAGCFGSARADIPDPPECEIWLAYDGPEIPALCVYPNGQGPTFTQSNLPNGEVVDATVYLEVRDGFGVPIVGFPREDIWITSYDDGLVFCNGGGSPDIETDADGITYWTSPPQAGGSSTTNNYVYVYGSPSTYVDLDFHFNSPDITGDGTISLADVGLFSSDYFGAYQFRSDFFYDGELNLSDVGRLAYAIGSSCP